jgi:excisionase family DNA binding protein
MLRRLQKHSRLKGGNMGETVDGQEYLSMDEASKIIGWNKATIYEWLQRLDMKTTKFVGNRKAFLKASDVERLKEVKAKPWMAGEKKPSTEEGIA